MDATAELGRNLVSKHQIQPEYGDEEADAGRDCRTRLARPNSQARTRTGNINFPCPAHHEQDWQPYPVDPYSYYMCYHTYIHIYISHDLGVALELPCSIYCGVGGLCAQDGRVTYPCTNVGIVPIYFNNC